MRQISVCIALLLVSAGGTSVEGETLTGVDIQLTVAVYTLQPVPVLTRARVSENETAAVDALRALVGSMSGGQSVEPHSYSTELTDLSESEHTLKLTPGLGFLLKALTVDPTVTRGIFMLQENDGTPVYGTETDQGLITPILGPLDIPLNSASGTDVLSLPSGMTLRWRVNDESEFNRVFAPTDPASIDVALAASHLETLEIDYATAIFDSNGRILSLVVSGQRAFVDPDNYERLFGLTASNDAFLANSFIAVFHDPVAMVPAPSTSVGLLGVGAVGLMIYLRRRKVLKGHGASRRTLESLDVLYSSRYPEPQGSEG